MLRGNGENWSEMFWATVFPPHLSARSNNSSATAAAQQSLSEQLGERRRLGQEVPVPAKWGKASSDIYMLLSFGKDAGFGQILSFEIQQARAMNSCSQVVGDKTGKAIWEPVKEA